MTRALAALLLLTAGCLPTDPTAVEAFVPVLSVLCGVASTAPAIEPEPDTPGVCLSCGGQGWLGDGTIKKDCPDCETPWKQPPPAASTPERQVIPLDGDAPSTATPAPEETPVWYSSYRAAVEVATETGRPLIVAVAETQPDLQPTAAVVLCWLPLATYPESFAAFDTPCTVVCQRIPEPDAEGRVTPIFEPYEG